jgi:hypothetical protein
MRSAFDQRDPLFQVAERARALRFAVARDAVERAWRHLGGPRAAVGLPVHKEIRVETSAHDPFEFCAGFRGGVLTLSDDGRRARLSAVEEIDLSLIGAEHLDSIAPGRGLSGVIAVLGPASATLQVRSFPADGDGALYAAPRGGRIATLDLPVLRAGRRQDYWICAVLVEDDAGAARITQALAERLRCAITSALDGASGPAAEGLVQRRSFRDSVASELAGFATEVARPGLEISPAVSLRLHWNAIGTPAHAAQPSRRDLGGATIISDWTHRIIVPGRSSDGCALYLKASTWIVPGSIAIDVPTAAATPPVPAPAAARTHR